MSALSAITGHLPFPITPAYVISPHTFRQHVYIEGPQHFRYIQENPGLVEAHFGVSMKVMAPAIISSCNSTALGIRSMASSFRPNISRLAVPSRRIKISILQLAVNQ